MLTEPAVRRYQRALLAVWDTADDHARTYGAEWYGAANAHAVALGARYGFTTAQAAGVIAALSPRVGWSDNLADAETILNWAQDARDGLPVADSRSLAGGCQGFHANVVKATEIVAIADPLAALNGPKQRAFYANIMGDAVSVTVDVWATRAATRGARSAPRGAGDYADISAAYRRAARAVGSTPRDFQAAVWLALRSAATASENGNMGGVGWAARRARIYR